MSENKKSSDYERGRIQGLRKAVKILENQLRKNQRFYDRTLLGVGSIVEIEKILLLLKSELSNIR
jgi:hypothetical protein